MKQIIAFLIYLKKIFVGYTTPPSVGVDISSSAIKMVELEYDSLVISKYSIQPLEKNLVTEGIINDIEQISKIVLDGWLKLGSTSQQVAISIPYNSVIIKEIKAPKFKSRYQLDDFVFDYLIKELDTDDIDFDYLINKIENDEQTLSVVVAKKEKIEEYQAIIQMTGIRVSAIDVEPFAIRHLFNLLLKSKPMLAPVLLIDSGSTRMRAYVFQDHKLILFSEISVNYNFILEELLLTHTDGINLKKIGAVDSYLFNLLKDEKLSYAPLVDAIIYDISKLIQLVKSNMLVERKISLADNVDMYLTGGNTIAPGTTERIKKLYAGNIYLISELLAKKNPNIPTHDIMRLTTAISLATWGQKID